MTFNFGGFAGGVANGLMIGKQIKDAFAEDEIAKVRAAGIAEARAMQAAGTPQVQDNGDMQNLTANPQASADPAAAPVNTSLAASPAMQGVTQPQADGMSTVPVAAPEATPTNSLSSTPMSTAAPDAMSPAPAAGVTIKGGKRFQVAGQGFDDLESAQAHAKKQAPDINDLMRKTLVPKMQEAYLAQGNPDKADAWGAWGESQDGKKKMKLWGQAMTAAQAGDHDAAADALVKLHGDLPDGRTYVGREDVKDKDGNVTGFNMTYKDDNTGEKKSQFVGKDELIEQGLSALSPQAMFETMYKAKTTADVMNAKDRAAAANDARDGARELAKAKVVAAAKEVERRQAAADAIKLEEIKSGHKMDEKRFESQLEAAQVEPKLRGKLNTQLSLLKQSGMSPAELKAAIPALVGVEGASKKVTDPTERRGILTTSIVNSGMFQDPNLIAPYVDKIMAGLYKNGGDVGDDAHAQVAKPAPAAAGGVNPRPAAAKPGAAPLMVYDPATKQMVQR